MLSKQFYYKKNRIQQLRGFYYTVQSGSISAAARIMKLSQAAVTLQIQSLERDLGIDIFTREGRKIKLSRVGKMLYAQASYHVHGIEDLFESFSKFVKNNKLNSVDVASNHVGISYILPKYIKKFKDQNPTVNFRIRNLSKAECIKRLLNDEIDMFVYPMIPHELPDELEFIPIVTYHPILLIRRDHPLAKKKNITLKEMAKFELIRIDPKLITLFSFEEVTKAHGFKSTIEFEMSDWEILKKFVKAGVGIAIISDIVLEGELENELIGKSITKYFPEMIYGILIKKGKIFDGEKFF